MTQELLKRSLSPTRSCLVVDDSKMIRRVAGRILKDLNFDTIKAGNGQEIAESAKTYATAEEAQVAAEAVQALLESEKVANPW